ncbi:MAG: long-chain fatty acid--CoA ligase [Gammaproteobacteria bacterium]|nr:long-chain fatty acid--CoA ligase [Gammaproteobacteria bacterium]
MPDQNTSVNTVRSFNFADLLELVAHEVPQRTALVCGDERLSYAELASRVEHLAATLDRRGLRAGETLALHCGNRPEYLIGFFAACRLGVLPFNVNYRYVEAELEYLYDNAKAGAAIVESEFLPRVRGLKSCPRIVVAAGEGDTDFAAALREGANLPAPARAPRSDDALIIYTGGTTGMPKGVVWGHHDMLRASLGGGGFFSRKGPIATPEEIVDRVRESPPLVTFPVAPLMHGAALWAALSSIFAGHTIVLQAGRGFDPVNVLDLCARERVNILVIVGDGMGRPLADALAAHAGRWSLETLVHIGSGGAVFSQAVQQSLRNSLPRLHTSSSLGTTESGTLGAGAAEGGGLMRFAPRPDIHVVVDGSRFAIPGEEGVLARSGPLPQGYFGDPERTARTFVTLEGQRLAITGDFARLEVDGAVTVLGRGSTCINTGGEKVFPEEVEQALKAHPTVFDALVVGVPDPRWGERVVAVVSLRDGISPESGAVESGTVGAEALREHCRALIAGYKVPRALAFVTEVRRTNTGKPDYAWAREAALAAGL